MSIIISLTIIIIVLRVSSFTLSTRLIKGVVDGESLLSKGSIVVFKGFLKVLIKVLTWIRNAFAILYALFILLMALVFCFILLTMPAFLVLFTVVGDDGSTMINPDIRLTAHRLGVVTEINASKNESPVKNLVVSGKPTGISDDSWNSADDIGRAVASKAYTMIVNKPNGKEWVYSQTKDGVGIADCSTFVCMALEGALGRTFMGGDCPNFDYNTQSKSNLSSYVSSKDMMSVLNSNPSISKGKWSTNKDDARPGDILLVDGHVAIFVGIREKDAQAILVNASQPNGTVSNTIDCVNKSDDVGFSDYFKEYNIIRTSELVKGGLR